MGKTIKKWELLNAALDSSHIKNSEKEETSSLIKENMPEP